MRDEIKKNEDGTISIGKTDSWTGEFTTSKKFKVVSTEWGDEYREDFSDNWDMGGS